MKKNFVWVLVLLLAVALSFYGGLIYGRGKGKVNRFSFDNMPLGERQFAGNGERNNKQGAMANGEILSLDESGLTLKLQDGGSRLIFFSSSTEIMRYASGTVADLKVGDNLIITGEDDSTGGLTAKSIQLRPENAFRPRE